MVNKEAIYDEQISPLMNKILEICKENKIAMVSSFAIPSPEDEDLVCTSALTTKEYAPPEQFVKAVQVIKTTDNSFV